MKATAKGKGKGKATGPSSIDSLSPTSSDADAAYATPATSIAVTPEASVKGKSTTRKRTRLSNEVSAEHSNIEYDQALAEALQREEYGEEEEARPIKRQKTQIKDEVEDSEDLSDAMSVEEESAADSDSEDGFEPRSIALAKARAGKKAMQSSTSSHKLSRLSGAAAGRASFGNSPRNTAKASDSDDLSDALSVKDESASISDSEDAFEPRKKALAKAKAGKKAAGRPSVPRKPARKAGAAAALNMRKSLGESKVKLDDSDSGLSALPPSADLSDEDDFVINDSDAEESSEAESSSDDDTPLANIARANNSGASDPTAPAATGSGIIVKGAKTKNRWGRRRGNQDVDMSEIKGLMTRKERERKKLEKAHPQIKTMWQDLEEIPVYKPVQAPQPTSINRTLKSFQREGLDWMINQEKTQYKGGLLGDEMGMGKTIQAVSLIMSDYPAKQPSMVIVPPVALMQWSSEIKDYTDGKLNVLVYHGQNAKTKGMTVKDLKKYDVIMISYNSLESVYRKQIKGWSRGEDIVMEASPIHAIEFHRIILDEAHSIKSRTTGVAKACFALKAKYKWCLSGTPVQNRIGEFFSLLRFLEVRPFADYFCKKCPCSMLHWDVDKDYRCTSCKHSSIEHVSVFNQELLNPLTQSEDMKDRSAAMDKLHMITARIMLRRMKRDHVSSMELPPKEVIVHNEFFGEIERDFSSSIMSNTARTFDTYVSRGVMLNNYANIFGLIMQMRQVANHPDLLLKKHAHEGQNVLVCNICDEPAEEAIRSKCKHDFCRSCVKSYVRSVEDNKGEPDCPRCHDPLSIDFDQPEIEQDEEAVKKNSIINRISMENWTSSTKIEMLVYDLWKLRSKKQTLKSIIFSQFTSMLQLVEWRLRRAGFNTVMLDGSMTPNQRQRSIDHFMNTPECEIFLVSLKAGGVALNLTEASRVFIIDP